MVTKFNLRKRIEERRLLLCFGFLVKASYRGILLLAVVFVFLYFLKVYLPLKSIITMVFLVCFL